MDTTRSFNSSTLGSIFASATQSLLPLTIIRAVPSFPTSLSEPLGPITARGGPIKMAQMLGAAEFPTEAYAAYAAGRGTRRQRRRWAIFIGPFRTRDPRPTT